MGAILYINKIEGVIKRICRALDDIGEKEQAYCRKLDIKIKQFLEQNPKLFYEKELGPSFLFLQSKVKEKLGEASVSHQILLDPYKIREVYSQIIDLPFEIQEKIFHELGRKALVPFGRINEAATSVLCKKIEGMIKKVRGVGFDDWKEWGLAFSKEEVQETLLNLPENLAAILNQPDPQNKKHKINSTHALICIPGNLTIKGLGSLAKAFFPGNTNGYFYFSPELWEKLSLGAHGKHRFVLITKRVLAGSQGKKFVDLQCLIQKLSETSKIPYKMGEVRDVAICTLAQYFKSQKRRYIVHYTRCQEIESCNFPPVVGFYSKGLSVDQCTDSGSIGVAPLWELLKKD